VELAQQVGALAGEDGGQGGGVGGAGGGHDFEEEVVAVAAGGDGGLAEPAVEFGAGGRGEVVDELATIRSFGWRDSALARLVVTEGTIIGVMGSLAGAGLGLGAAAWFAACPPPTCSARSNVPGRGVVSRPGRPPGRA
jgi:hypothetical protein